VDVPSDRAWWHLTSLPSVAWRFRWSLGSWVLSSGRGCSAPGEDEQKRKPARDWLGAQADQRSWEPGRISGCRHFVSRAGSKTCPRGRMASMASMALFCAPCVMCLRRLGPAPDRKPERGAKTARLLGVLGLSGRPSMSRALILSGCRETNGDCPCDRLVSLDRTQDQSLGGFSTLLMNNIGLDWPIHMDATRLDVSRLINPGRNTLAMRLVIQKPPILVSGADQGVVCGIPTPWTGSP
jgi:hypothetical protein